MSEATITVSVPRALDAFVRERARDGNFGTADEYVASLIREDQQRSAAQNILAEIETEYRQTHPDASGAKLDELRASYWQRWQQLKADLNEAERAIAYGEGIDADARLIADIKDLGRRRLRTSAGE